MNSIFHLSLPSKDIQETKKFYFDDLGLEGGRFGEEWIDVNLFSHQLTFVAVDKFNIDAPSYTLDKNNLPTFHFGVILEYDAWEKVYDSINHWSSDIITKTNFFKDQNGEHMSFFVEDPNGYVIEFKSFLDHDDVFEM
jgi:extradiol dioxygenase family protein